MAASVAIATNGTDGGYPEEQGLKQNKKALKFIVTLGLMEDIQKNKD